MSFLEGLSLLLLYLKLANIQPGLTWRRCFTPALLSVGTNVIIAIITFLYATGWL